MDRDTVDIYEHRGREWIAARLEKPRQTEAESFAASIRPGALRADLGCGGGRYLGDIGSPVLGLDAAATMLGHAASEYPGGMLVQADLEALPMRRFALGGAWASNSYLHVPSVRLPMAFAELHRAIAVGGTVDVHLIAGDADGLLDDDDIGGRFFSLLQPQRLRDLLAGAGFTDVAITADDRRLRATATRARSLADTVGPQMRMLVCGLNPSERAADAGVGFVTPGNRFWPAAVAAAVVTRDRDPSHALTAHGIGMTDLVKRATRRSAELDRAEYRDGFNRVTRLVEWLQPKAVCFVGLEGFRAAVAPKAKPGWQPDALGGRPLYVMPSTSGLNARVSPDELTDHLRMASDGPPTARTAS